MRLKRILAGAVAGMALAAGAWGAADPAEARGARATRPEPTTARPKNDQSEILEQLASGDAAQQKLAVEAIRARVQARGAAELRAGWLRPMASAKLHKEVAELAQEAILLTPSETRSVEAALAARVRALIALGRPEQALAEAKGLFNVATMTGTSEAILVVAECIAAARPNDVKAFNAFRAEQIAGAAAAAPVTQPAAHPTTRPVDPVRSPVLDSIKVDDKPYREALARFPGEDATNLMARGNLLLLADRPGEAWPIFERMYSLSGVDIVEASESLARCMKAEDGTIGRANAWILSIRPKASRP
jgi:hypothetical protein